MIAPLKVALLLTITYLDNTPTEQHETNVPDVATCARLATELIVGDKPDRRHPIKAWAYTCMMGTPR